MKFTELNLIEPILRSLQEEGYETPTPIQQQSIPHSIQGRDLLACAQTGTGKTAAFAIPILQRLNAKYGAHNTHHIKTLILTPTRELAIQIGDSFTAYGRHLKLRNAVIFGGVGQKPQEDTLKKGVDILIATPGRLLDLMNQGFVKLDKLEIFVLDEADRMLDMGFIHDVRKVIKALPTIRQTLFFSATMPPEIAKLAHDILTDPIKVAVTPVSSTAELIDQRVYFVDKNRKKHLLLHLLQNEEIKSVLVFTRTKHGANRVAQDLTKSGINAMAIHGNKSQSARQNALQNFKTGEIKVLVATDIAARGIDLEELSHVINFDLPNVPETYVHRIGRTGRAGATGIAFSFCDQEEKAYLRDIEKLINKKVTVVNDHPYPLGSGANDKPEADDRPPRTNNHARNNNERNAPRRERGNSNQQRDNKRTEQTLPLADGAPTSSDPNAPPSRNSRRRGGRRRGKGGKGGEGQQLQGTQSQNTQHQSAQQQGQPQQQRSGESRPQQPRNNQPRQHSVQRQGDQPQQQRSVDNKPQQQQRNNQPQQQQLKQQPRPPQPQQKREEADDASGKWSSLFQATKTGAKGFVIKSDRDEMSANKKKDWGRDRRKPRGNDKKSS